MCPDFKKIAYAGGFWSTNIGNSFYNIGVVHQLENTLSNGKVYFLSDHPAHYWNQKGKNPVNAFKYLDYFESDYIVFSGPCLNKQFPLIWGETLKALTKRGTKIILMSVGCSSYSPEEIKICRDVLKKYPPYLLMTRDEYTYKNFNDLAEYSYNGICGAFFLPDAYQYKRENAKDMIVMNFDGGFKMSRTSHIVNDFFSKYGIENEPKIHSIQPKSNQNVIKVNLFNKDYFLEYDYKPYHLANLFSKTEDKYPTNIDQHPIIRTKHRTDGVSTSEGYNKPNTFLSDIPYNYLDIYANAHATFSNRVHACVATLAYGNPAMFFSNTKRSKLFERFNSLDNINKSLASIPPETLEYEKLNQLEYLKEIINN